jgi:hypothetical protein
MTATANTTLQSALDQARPGQTDDALRLMKLGTMLTPLKRTFAGLTSAAFFDLTTIDGTGETTGASNPKRVAALSVATLRVTAGAAAAGARLVTDAGGTPSATVATISDDGKTVTFEAGVTAFVIEYIPRSNTDMTSTQSAFDGAP